MRFIEEFRDPALVRMLLAKIAELAKNPWTIMEVCGGQTHAILRHGLDQLLPKTITLLHGPGCPVCVTPIEIIDQAIEIAAKPEVIFCTFGDMMRVPGSSRDLFSVKSEGGEVHMVYSPLDALKIAKDQPEKEVVFFAIGFETTAPANAMAVLQAQRDRIVNFSMLMAQVLVPPALQAILSSSNCQVDGFLAAGHVCTVMGVDEYRSIAERYRTPIVVTGFEPLDILKGILSCVEMLENGRAEVRNQYTRAVRDEGNVQARRIICEVFKVVPRKWRGIGEIAQSGLGLAERFISFDAGKRFGLTEHSVAESSDCISGLVLQGIRKPPDCPAFGNPCTPEHPLGATMVSSEGACAAYFRYRRIPDRDAQD